MKQVTLAIVMILGFQAHASNSGTAELGSKGKVNCQALQQGSFAGKSKEGVIREADNVAREKDKTKKAPTTGSANGVG